jgi:hypothetical protein
VFLSLPLFGRVIVISLSLNTRAAGAWFDKHFTTANNVAILLDTFLPIITQTLSLIFGFTRNSKDKNIARM